MKKEKIETPDISRQLSFLKDSTWQFRKLTPTGFAMIEKSFREVFEILTEDEQKAISLQLNALDIEIRILDNQNEGVAIVRDKEIASRFRELLDRSGVVASTKEGGLDSIREELTVLMEKTLTYLQEYESFAESVKDKSADTKENTEYIFALISGIRSEFVRLKFPNRRNLQQKGEFEKERNAQLPVYTPVGQIGSKLEHSIELEGLIGFSTLNKLINLFCSVKRRLEDACLNQ